MRAVEPWKTLSSCQLADYRIARMRSVRRKHPLTKKEHEFYVLDCPDWVNIVALTPERNLILVRQYRHGTDTVDLETPGGVMDPSDPTPEFTAVRELREETGLSAGDWTELMRLHTSNSITDEYGVVYVAKQLTQGDTDFEEAEDLAVRKLPLTEAVAMVERGEITDAISVAALLLVARKPAAQ